MAPKPAFKELLLSLVILANFIIIILEANYGAACDGELITSHAGTAWGLGALGPWGLGA